MREVEAKYPEEMSLERDHWNPTSTVPRQDDNADTDAINRNNEGPGDDLSEQQGQPEDNDEDLAGGSHGMGMDEDELDDEDYAPPGSDDSNDGCSGDSGEDSDGDDSQANESEGDSDGIASDASHDSYGLADL